MKPTEKQLIALREAIEKDPSVSEKRRRHILAVERMAVTLGELYAPESIGVLRAAALLHDLTKEYTTERHLELLGRAGKAVREVELSAPKTLHAMTAAQLIPELYGGEISKAGQCIVCLPNRLSLYFEGGSVDGVTG